MKKILLFALSIVSLSYINPIIAGEKKESIEQEKKSDDVMEKEMGHDMKHYRMKHHRMNNEKKDDSKKDGANKEDEKN
ncbi:MAG: hypothetical protein ACR2IC_02790 [Candidatus Methylopumilus sp.]